MLKIEKGDWKVSLQKTMKALSDPIRREILGILKNGPLAAGEISGHFLVTDASISRHLSVLKEADMIRDRREGKFIYYELNTSVLEDVMIWISALKGEDKDAEKESGIADCDLFCHFDAHSGRIDFL